MTPIREPKPRKHVSNCIILRSAKELKAFIYNRQSVIDMHKVRQHTVPRFYLRTFSADKRTIDVCPRDSSGKFSSNIGNVAVKKNIYTLPMESKLDPMALENAFCLIESDAAPLFERIDRNKEFPNSDKSLLAPFFASQLKRTTIVHEKYEDFRVAARKPEKVIAYVQRNKARYEKRLGQDEVDKFLADVAAGRVELDISPAELMLEAQRNIKAYVEILLDMSWCLVRSREPVFVTSDNPVYVRRRGFPLDKGPVGLERQDLEAELYCPLSPRTFLIANWDGRNPHSNPIRSTRAKELNRLTVCCSNRYVFGKISNTIESLISEHMGFRLELPTWDPENLVAS